MDRAHDPLGDRVFVPIVPELVLDDVHGERRVAAVVPHHGEDLFGHVALGRVVGRFLVPKQGHATPWLGVA